MQNWEWTKGLFSTKTFVFVLFKITDGGITYCFTPHYTSCVMNLNICMKVHKGIFKSFHPFHMCFISAKQKYLWLIQWTELFHHYIIGSNYSTKFQKLTANWTYDINDASMVMLHHIKLNYITSHQITPKWHTMEYLKLTSFKFFWLKHPDLLSFEVLQHSVQVELCCINHFFNMWSWSGALSEWNQSCNFPF